MIIEANYKSIISFRVYPELDIEELSILPMSEAEILCINRGVLLQQRDRLEDTFIEMYSEER